MSKLSSIPFYNGLLGKELFIKEDGTPVLATNTHILVYGAIEVHSRGKLGCVASNKTIGEECGVSDGRTANIISELAKAGWVTVALKGRLRKGIITNLSIDVFTSRQSETHATVKPFHTTVKSTSRQSEVSLHASVNIDNILDNNLDNSIEESVAWQPLVNYFYEKCHPSTPFPVRFRKGTKECALHLISLHGEPAVRAVVDSLAILPEKKYAPSFLKFSEQYDTHANRVELAMRANPALKPVEKKVYAPLDLDISDVDMDSVQW